MKKLSVEMLRLTSDEVLGRSQMKKITGGRSWICTCGNNPPITVWDEDIPGSGGGPTQICSDVYGTGGHCTAAMT
jgi:natural product precursor